MHRYASSLPALVDSLLDDPFYQAITVDFAGDPTARKAALGRYFHYSLEEAERTGRCVIASDATLGAAAWLLPRTPAVEATESAAKTRYLAHALGPRGNENYHRAVAFMARQAPAVVPGNAWYLSIVGILPSAQGRGAGAALLAGTLAEARAAGAVSYLETFSPRSQVFYGRLGFQVTGVFLDPTTCAEYAVMCCAP